MKALQKIIRAVNGIFSTHFLPKGNGNPEISFSQSDLYDSGWLIAKLAFKRLITRLSGINIALQLSIFEKKIEEVAFISPSVRKTVHSCN